MEKSSFWKRITFTLLILAVYKVGTHTPAPWINQQSLVEYFNQIKPAGEVSGAFSEDGQKVFGKLPAPRLTLFALGIIPYVDAAIVIELIIFVFPTLSISRLAGNSAGRKKIVRLTCYLAFIIAVVNSYSICLDFESMVSHSGKFVVSSPGWGFRLGLSLTLISGFSLLLWLAEQITRRGIGNGISLIIFMGLISRIPLNIGALKQKYELGEMILSPPFLILLILGLVLLVVLMEKASLNIPVQYHRDSQVNNKVYYLPYKMTLAGVIPLYWAITFTVIPMTAIRFIDHPIALSITNYFSPDTLLYHVSVIGFLFMFYYLFAAVFYNTYRIKRYLQQVGASWGKVDSHQITEENLTNKIYKLAFVGFLYLSFFLFLPDFFTEVLNIPFNYGGKGFILLVVIAIDLIMEIKGYLLFKQGNLVKIAKLHDVPQAGLIKNVLEQNDIFCHVQGYYHRSLLYLFGPYIEMGIMVPQLKTAQAKALIEEYIDREGNILMNSLSSN
jgi:preprotein translocase subunit SecY